MSWVSCLNATGRFTPPRGACDGRVPPGCEPPCVDARQDGGKVLAAVRNLTISAPACRGKGVTDTGPTTGLTGMRTSEAAIRRWRDWEPPFKGELGRLVPASSLNGEHSRRQRTPGSRGGFPYIPSWRKRIRRGSGKGRGSSVAGSRSRRERGPVDEESVGRSGLAMGVKSVDDSRQPTMTAKTGKATWIRPFRQRLRCQFVRGSQTRHRAKVATAT